MIEVLAFLQSNVPLFENMTLWQFNKVIFGMLVVCGPITLLGLSLWTEKGGSYRSIQWFYCSSLPWQAIPGLFLPKRFFHSGSEYIAAGDETVSWI
jgi:putative transposase